MILRPNPGRQSQFLANRATLCIYGGAAGGGKSHGLLLEPMRHISKPGFTGKIFRRTYAEATGPGSLWEKTFLMYYPCQGSPNNSDLVWKFPSGAQIGLGHLQHEKDMYSHMGAEYAFIGFDELTRFEESQFWFLVSRNRSTSGVKPYLRATCNPDPEHFTKRLIRWWLDADGRFPDPLKAGVIRWLVRDGDDFVWFDEQPDRFRRIVELRRKDYPGYMPLSVSFIPASLDDNPALLEADPGYKSKLLDLPLIERQRLLYGDWLIKPSAGMYFKREWLPIVRQIPALKDIKRMVRYWDRAATAPKKPGHDPDYTVGLLLAQHTSGALYVADVKRLRGTPLDVEQAIERTAAQDAEMFGNGQVQIWLEEDPGQSGKADISRYKRLLSGYTVRSLRPVADKRKRAEPASSSAEGGGLFVVAGAWNEPFINELESFPDGSHDDQVDALSGAVAAITQRKSGFV